MNQIQIDKLRKMTDVLLDGEPNEYEKEVFTEEDYYKRMTSLVRNKALSVYRKSIEELSRVIKY